MQTTKHNCRPHLIFWMDGCEVHLIHHLVDPMKSELCLKTVHHNFLGWSNEIGTLAKNSPP